MKVLLPTDFSENAWHAINYAVFLFENTACTFYVLHAHQASPSGLVSTINKERDTRLHEITLDESREKLYKTVGQLKKINKVKDHSFEAVLESEALLNAVGRNVIDLDIDYICMGTQGASGFKEIFLGSNTVKLIKNINFCPVIAVPESYLFSRPDSIAFATDYKHLYQKNELAPLLDIARLWDSTIRVIHVKAEESLSEMQQELKSLLSQFLKNIPFEADELDYHPNINLRINEWVESNGCGMLCMINSSHEFFSRILREPVVRKIAFRTHIPFLVLPEAV